MKIFLKIISSLTTISLKNPICISKIKISKIKFRIIQDNIQCLFININDYGLNKYYDGINDINYLFSFCIPDNTNNIIFYDNISDNYDLYFENKTPLTYLKFNILNDNGGNEWSINPENPLMIELEIDDIINNDLSQNITLD